jgi:hypothetical protein
LSRYLKKNRVDYGGPLLWDVKKDDVGYEESWDPLKMYVSGTAIIFSTDTMKNVLKYKDEIDRRLIDDVSIGKLIAQKMSDKSVKSVLSNRFYIMEKFHYDDEALFDFLQKNNILFYRNNTQDREMDAHQMNIIVQYLLPM